MLMNMPLDCNGMRNEQEAVLEAFLTAPAGGPKSQEPIVSPC